ncbi:DUF4124 domain-containing protein [Porticoccus sp.]|uniref:DUF4124 domain-containing protein n=1 Tax=Porticoccus sp. TaxID=2024853 RepID=UPI003F69F29D
MKVCLLVLLLCLTPLSQAAIYRWVDENGKIHFSDKQPENNATAQDISGELRPLNNDSSTTETEKLKAVFQGATPEEKAFNARQKAEQEKQYLHKQRDCQKARNQLRVLRGRVAFEDTEGNEIIISEEERQQRAKQLEQQIQIHCS